MPADVPDTRIQSEEQPARPEAAVPVRQSETTALANVLPVGIFRTDLDGRCFYMSEPLSDLTAIERAGAAGFFTKGSDTQRLIDHLMIVQATTTLGLPG